MRTVIAIDGTAASGKSSVAYNLARRLGWLYVNTGAMYRAVTWLALQKGVDSKDTAAVLAAMQSAKIEFGRNGKVSTILIDGVDPSAHLGDAEVNANVSAISSIAEVRRILVERQKAYGEEDDLVMEGRDIGSVVFPETPYKFYIDANPEVRAMRRSKQGLADNPVARDQQDSTRRAGPLVLAADAHPVDSSYLTIDGVVGEIIGRLKLKGLKLPDGI